jgi:hypothetical protein
MRLIARKGKFVCALLTVILSGSLFTRVVFADDEPKTVPAGDEQPKKLGRAKRKLDGNLIQPLVRRPRLRSRNVALFRRRLIRYFLAQTISGPLHSSACPTRIPSIRWRRLFGLHFQHSRPKESKCMAG